MKKFLALFTVVMLLAAAGCAFAADAGHGTSTGDDPYADSGNTETPTTPTSPDVTPTPGGDTSGGAALVPPAATVAAFAANLPARFAGFTVVAINPALIGASHTLADIAQAIVDALKALGLEPLFAFNTFGPFPASTEPTLYIIAVPEAGRSALRGKKPHFHYGRRGAGASFVAAADDVASAPTATGNDAVAEPEAVFVDDQGNEVTEYTSGNLNVAAAFEGGNTYDPVLAAADDTSDGGNTPSDGGNTPSDGGNTPSDGGNTPSDGGNTPSDGGNTPSDGGNTPSDGGNTPSDEPVNNVDPGSSGGGCDAGFSVLALAALAGFVARKR